LVEQALEREAVIIVMRAFQPWLNAVPKLKSYNRCYTISNWQSPYLTARNCPQDYSEIVMMLDQRFEANQKVLVS
jgi:hypothetical protein